MNEEEEIIDELYPLMREYYEEGTLFGRNLMNYIKLIHKLKKLNPELAKGYILENNAINTVSIIDDICAICLDPIDSTQRICLNRNCSHVYHWDCVRDRSIEKCPKCRAPFVRKLVEKERVYFGNTLESDYRYLLKISK